MGEVVDRAVAANQPMITERGQRFKLQRPPGTLEVQGDAARLEQVVSNLLDNASKYTHEGGRIGLSIDVTADTLKLTVADNGIGITPQMLPHVFEPFVQDAQALCSSGVGLGIGSRWRAPWCRHMAAASLRIAPASVAAAGSR